jgi:hypothetical protein
MSAPPPEPAANAGAGAIECETTSDGRNYALFWPVINLTEMVINTNLTVTKPREAG